MTTQGNDVEAWLTTEATKRRGRRKSGSNNHDFTLTTNV